MHNPAGGIHLMTLASILDRRLDEIQAPAGRVLPTITMAFIIDSAPGSDDYESIMSSFTLSITSPILKATARLPLTLAYIAYYLTYNKLFNNPLLLPLLHKFLEQQRPLPGSDGESPRLYIYSDTDSMVPWTSVERHLSMLSANKVPFMAEKYIGSQHVSHARHDSRRYWGAVAAVWESALRRRQMPNLKGKL